MTDPSSMDELIAWLEASALVEHTHAEQQASTGRLTESSLAATLARKVRADVASAMDAPMEVVELDARNCKIVLKGPKPAVVANARRDILYRQVAMVLVGGEP